MDATIVISILIILVVIITKELFTSLSNDVEFRRATAMTESKREETAYNTSKNYMIIIQKIETFIKSNREMQPPLEFNIYKPAISVIATLTSAMIFVLKMKIIGVAASHDTYILIQEINALATLLDCRLYFICVENDEHKHILLKNSIEIAASITQSIKSSISNLTKYTDQHLTSTILASGEDIEKQIIRLQCIITD